jgi:lincosamide nucleotidyltransferase A/C/D/E
MSEGATQGPASPMPAHDVVDLYELFEQDGIKVWVDGGWGVDALLGQETRPHGDLDVALELRQLPQLEELLGSRGYGRKGEREARPWNFVLRDSAGHLVDLHAFTFDDAGNGLLGPPENGAAYPAHALTGVGIIRGRHVRCIAVEAVLRFHSQYEPRERDFKDVQALCARFGLDLPERYKSGAKEH